jgi:hypothetical protein
LILIPHENVSDVSDQILKGLFLKVNNLHLIWDDSNRSISSVIIK